MSKVLEFNDRIDAVCRDNERELLAIEARRSRNTAVASDIKQEMLEAFQELEVIHVID